MTTRTPLDLRGLSLTELMQASRELEKELGVWFDNPPDDIAAKLADRHQIRALMEIIRREQERPDYEIEAARNVYP